MLSHSFGWPAVTCMGGWQPFVWEEQVSAAWEDEVALSVIYMGENRVICMGGWQ